MRDHIPNTDIIAQHMTLQDESMDLVPKVMLDFQWLEESIKYYIVRAEFAIVSHVQNVFRYTPMALRKLEKMTLGQLVEYFAGHNGNDDLIRRLRAVVQHRNHVAHGGYLLYLDENETVSDITGRLARLKTVYSEVHALVPLLFTEIESISARLGASIHRLPFPS